jgi:hypothetical protein
MLDILDQIERAKNAGLYYAALFSALSIPDIAGALDSSDGRAKPERFAAWFDTYVGPKYVTPRGQTLLGNDCYYFRCALLHQGTRRNYSRTTPRRASIECSFWSLGTGL